MTAFHWTCPYCQRAATVQDENRSHGTHFFSHNNKRGNLLVRTSVVVCPNRECKEFTLRATLYHTEYAGSSRRAKGGPIHTWQLLPRASMQILPDFVPAPIREDYEEACLIRDASPKAAATLARRCIQGMIRDYWGIRKGRLFDEIAALEERVDPLTWDAIDSVRTVGNIGAHMEKDINVIVEVDPEEAQLLIGLIEVLVRDWYVLRHDREQRLKAVSDLAAIKKGERQRPVSEGGPEGSPGRPTD